MSLLTYSVALVLVLEPGDLAPGEYRLIFASLLISTFVFTVDLLVQNDRPLCPYRNYSFLLMLLILVL